MTENELESFYWKLISRYKVFAGQLTGDIEDELRDKNVGFIKVEKRLKELDSFQEKFKRKKYQDPSEIKDICGLRIVIRDSADVNKAIKVMNLNFDVRESVDKNNSLDLDQFGYRSFHLIINIKKAWRSVPTYKDSKDLPIEIQIRSELMDTWANFSHTIFYKKEASPKSIERKLYRLSALMEIADSEISQIINDLATTNQIQKQKIKSLQILLDEYLPHRKRALEKPLAELIEDMEKYDFPITTLKRYLQTKKEELFQIEKEAFSGTPEGVDNQWWQTGVVYGLMFLTIDDYWHKEGTQYSERFVSVIEQHRKTFKF